jgi:hypothetical protein
VEASYWRGDMLEERRRLMEERAAFREAPPAAKEAVRFGRQIAS